MSGMKKKDGTWSLATALSWGQHPFWEQYPWNVLGFVDPTMVVLMSAVGLCSAGLGPRFKGLTIE